MRLFVSESLIKLLQQNYSVINPATEHWQCTRHHHLLFLHTQKVCLHVCVSSPSAQPVVEINKNWEVVYQDTSVYGVVGKAVILECGPTLPDMYIWSFTKPGTEAIRAVVYDLGKGTRIQNLAETLGTLTIISKSAAVSIEKLPLAAHGLFTCQAFYDIDKEPKVYYYYVHLTVRGKTTCTATVIPSMISICLHIQTQPQTTP